MFPAPCRPADRKPPEAGVNSPAPVGPGENMADMTVIEPTSQQCTDRAQVGPGIACWYPQMGGYAANSGGRKC